MDQYRSRSPDRTRNRNRNRDSEQNESRQPSYGKKPEKPSGHFRFEDLDIWKLAMEIAGGMFDMADDPGVKIGRLMAETLIECAVEIAGNIADGSATSSDEEFDDALVRARRYIHRAASMMFLLDRRGLIPESVMAQNLEQLNILNRKMYSFQKSLRGETKKSGGYSGSR